MASGFIILRDGRCFSVRWTIHDVVFQSVAEAMNEGTPLRNWLCDQIPSPLDVEMGYGFIRTSDGEHISRSIDLRGMTEANQKLFETAARRAKPIPVPPAAVESVNRALRRLREMLDRCDSGEPPLSLSDWTVEAPPVEERVGPGWEHFSES